LTAFGDVAALWDTAQKLELVPLLDSVLPAKRRQGLSCGQYLLLAATVRAFRINRAVSPTSKLQFADWYDQTVLTRLLPAQLAWLSSQNFWHHTERAFRMHRVTADHILECEKRLAQRLVERFQIDLRALVYDGTNFFTYINTRTSAQLPQRGHNKQKRGDLRQVSLGLLVSTDFHTVRAFRIPLFHQVYAGNVHDSVAFRSITEELAAHYRQLAQACEHTVRETRVPRAFRITVIFDKGNNSQEGLDNLAATPFHFVGSLVPSQHPDLLAVPRRRFQALGSPRLRNARSVEGVEVYRTQKQIFGPTRTVVVTFNAHLYEGQLQGLTANLNPGRAVTCNWLRDSTGLRRARRKLQELQTHLKRRRQGKVKGGKASTLDSVRKQIRAICGTHVTVFGAVGRQDPEGRGARGPQRFAIAIPHGSDRSGPPVPDAVR